MPLTQEEIAALLAPKRKSKAPQVGRGNSTAHYEIPEQTSKLLRWIPKSEPCASRDLHPTWPELTCGAPSHYKFLGEPFCAIHLIHILADMLEERINHYPNRSTVYEKQLELYYNKEIKPMLHLSETPPGDDAPVPEPPPDDQTTPEDE